jgi:hydroxyacylglutathione hydrolase
VEVVTIETPALGDRSYLIHDGRVGLVIDPQRDIDRVMQAAAAAGVRITHVAETHLHNDYVSGGLDLARRSGAAYLVPAGDDVAFERQPVGDGYLTAVGGLQVRAIATPGHTHHHLAYLVSEAGEPVALFTGGSLLYGTVGRTDLLGPEAAEDLTRAQYRSARRLAAEVPDAVGVWPTHGFGSFCSSAKSSGASAATMGDERTGNMAFTIEDEDVFVTRLLEGLTAYPRYYAHMAPINRAGPAPFDLPVPQPLDGDGLRRQLQQGSWLVDLAQRRAYARGHLPGTLSIELGDQFATYLGWVLPWGDRITLVGDSAAQVCDAQRALARIGIDHLAGAAAAPREDLAGGRDLESYPVAGFPELAGLFHTDRRPLVLDVRREDERALGGIEGSLHIPLQDLAQRIDEIPDGTTLWVHCASGFRASIAASLLAKLGKPVVLIDDEWAHTAGGGLPVTAPSSNTHSSARSRL